jgi:hypothetical protein
MVVPKTKTKKTKTRVSISDISNTLSPTSAKWDANPLSPWGQHLSPGVGGWVSN